MKVIAFIIISLNGFCCLAQGDVDWYENLFRGKKLGLVDEVLESRQREYLTAQADKDFERQATILNECAVLHLTRTFDYGAAMDTLIRALEVEEVHRLSNQQIYTYLTIAKVFAELNSHDKSISFLNKAVAMMPPDDNSLQALIYNDLGDRYMAMGQLNDARVNFEKVLDFGDDLKKRVFRAKAFFNLGQLLVAEIKYQPALNNHRQALAIFRSIADRQNEATSLNNIGELYRQMRNFNKALDNHLVAINIRKALGDRGGLAESYNNVGRLYLERQDYTHAISYLLLAQDESLGAQDRHELSRSNEYLSECYEATQDFEKALKYKTEYVAIRELIQGEVNEQKSLESQNEYELTKRKTRIDSLEADKITRDLKLEKAEWMNRLYIGGFLIIGAFIAFGLSLYIQKRNAALRLQQAYDQVEKQKLELEELNATKDKFFSIISHDLKGPLNSLSSFSSLLINHTDHLSKDEIKNFAQDFDKSLKNLFTLLENLLDWSRSQTGNIDFTPESVDATILLSDNKALLDGQAKTKRIKIHFEIVGEMIVRIHKNSINTVIRNLISNAIKFTTEGGDIWIHAAQEGKEVKISIKDNGVGMSEDIVSKLFRIDSKHSTKGTANEKGTGLGLILCKEFVEKNGGQLWVESAEGKGSAFYFTLPRG